MFCHRKIDQIHKVLLMKKGTLLWHYQLSKPKLRKADKDQLHYITFRAFSRCFLSKATYSNSHIPSYTVGGAAAMQGADQHTRSILGFSILPKVTSTCRPGETNQQPSDNKTLALPQSHSPPTAISNVQLPSLSTINQQQLRC